MRAGTTESPHPSHLCEGVVGRRVNQERWNQEGGEEGKKASRVGWGVKGENEKRARAGKRYGRIEKRGEGREGEDKRS